MDAPPIDAMPSMGALPTDVMPPLDLSSFFQANPTLVSDLIKSNPEIIPAVKSAMTPEVIQQIAGPLIQDPAVQAYIKSYITIDRIKPYIDEYTDKPPLNFPSQPAFTAAGIDFTPFLLAGLIFPLLFITLILVVMKNCYGYVFVFLWIVIIALWIGLNAIFFKRTHTFQKQLNRLSEYGLIALAIIFAILTAIGIVLRVLSIPLMVLASPLSSAAPAIAPAYQAPPAPTYSYPFPQAAGGNRKPPPKMIYIGPRK